MAIQQHELKGTGAAAKMLIRGTYKQIASAAWQSPILKKELQLLVLKDFDQKCTAMCKGT